MFIYDFLSTRVHGKFFVVYINVLRTNGSVGKYLSNDKCYFDLFAEKVFKVIFSCNSRLIMLSYYIVLT